MRDTSAGAREGERESVAAVVRSFYEALPFNFHAGVGSSVEAVLANPVAAVYTDLDALLRSGRVRSVLELGCGTGWLANTLARHYAVEVVAVDFTRPALARAREVAERLDVSARVEFIESDLFEYRRDAPFDLVVSIGVLHHTGDAAGGARHAAKLVKQHGHLYLGLYHEPGRRLFLDTMRKLAANEGEEAAFQRYWQLDHSHQDDETLARSWFRDQVLHPHESQHTLREVVTWLAPLGFVVESSSINRFAPIRDLEAVCALEAGYEARARRALEIDGRYFPGFFTALACRRKA